MRYVELPAEELKSADFYSPILAKLREAYQKKAILIKGQPYGTRKVPKKVYSAEFQLLFQLLLRGPINRKEMLYANYIPDLHAGNANGKLSELKHLEYVFYSGHNNPVHLTQKGQEYLFTYWKFFLPNF